jgi:hypothetical protein
MLAVPVSPAAPAVTVTLPSKPVQKPKEVVSKPSEISTQQAKLPARDDLEYPNMQVVSTPKPTQSSLSTPVKIPIPPKTLKPPVLEVKYQRKTESIKALPQKKNDSYLFVILVIVALLIAALLYFYKKTFKTSLPQTSYMNWILPVVYADIKEQEITPDLMMDNLEGKKKIFQFPTSITLDNVRISPIRSIFGFELDIELPSTSCALGSELWGLKVKVFMLDLAEKEAELAALNKACPQTKNFIKKNNISDSDLKKIKKDFHEFLKGKEVGLEQLVRAKALLEVIETNSEGQNSLFLHTLRAVIFARVNNQVAAARNISEFLKQSPYQIYFNSFRAKGRSDWSEILFTGIEYLKENLLQQDLFLLYGEYLKNIIDQPQESEKINKIFPDISYKKIDQMLGSPQSFKLFPSTWYFVLYQKKFRERANQLMLDWSSVMSNIKEREKTLWTLPYWSANNPDALLLGWISGHDKMTLFEKYLAIELSTILPYKAIFEKIVPPFSKPHFQLARDFYSKNFLENRPKIFFLYKLYALGDKDLSYIDSLYNSYEKDLR